MVSFCKFLFKVGVFLLGLGVFDFLVGAFSFVPICRHIYDFFYEYPYIGAVFGMAGFAAGVLGVILLLLYLILRLTKRESGLRLHYVLALICGGILWCWLFHLGMPV